MNEEDIGGETEMEIEDEVDTLFKVQLADFIAVRNNLVARLKRAGRTSDANLVKALAKPPISAWAVNQIYWRHREAFDRLLVESHRFRQAQTPNTAGRIENMRELLRARREALSHLSDLAAILLRDAGHNATPDTIHRITTTLEAISAYATLSDGPTPGRLTQDVAPPGLESLASLIPGAGATELSDELTRVTPSQTSGSAETKTRQRASPVGEAQEDRRREETHRARIAAAKVSLQEARKSLTETRARAERLEEARKKAYADAKQVEKQLYEAEEHVKKIRAASQDAAHRAQRVAAEAEEAAKAMEDARRTIEKASNELESLFQEPTAS
jgi:hypothetical protein